MASRFPDALRPLARRFAQATGTAASPNLVDGGIRAAQCLWTGPAARDAPSFETGHRNATRSLPKTFGQKNLGEAVSMSQ